MDGTLVDSEQLWLEGETRTMRALGAGWGPQDQAHCLGGPLERVAQYMVERAASTASAQEVGATLLAEVLGLMRSAPPIWQPGARALLLECRRAGVPCALVSASWRVLMDAVVEGVSADLGFDPFAVLVSGDEVAHSKPHPEPYLTAADRLGVAIEDCVAIEDSPTGVRSAHASGAFTLAVPHLVPIGPEPGLLVIPTLEGVDLQRLQRWRLEHGDGALR